MAVDVTGKPAQATEPTKPAQENEQAKSQETGARKFTDDEAASLLKELMALKAKNKKIEDAEAKRDEEAKKANGKHLELYETEKQKVAKLEDTLRASQLKLAAKLAGLDDMDYLALIDHSKITYGDDHAPIGIQDAIDDLKARKPALFTTTTTPTPKTPIPTKLGLASGPATFADYLKMPQADRAAYQAKHPDAYQALVRAAKGLAPIS